MKIVIHKQLSNYAIHKTTAVNSDLNELIKSWSS